MKSLGKIIKKKTGAKNLEALTQLIKKAPYSQPIQKLGKELLNDDAKDILLRYDWTEEGNVDIEVEGKKDGVSMDVIKFKKSKKKSSKHPKSKKKEKEKSQNAITKKDDKKSDQKVKAKEIKKKNSEKEEKSTKSKDTSKKIKSKKSDKTQLKKNKPSKKTKSKKDSAELDDYTVWLNSLKNPQITALMEAKKSKSKAKKKKSKNSKKNPLKSKIDLSVKANDKIASKSLAKLYAKKGHYKKAIKVYEELSLKNPGKSGFFAAQIQKLKDKL
jgi:hypothetical protein